MLPTIGLPLPNVERAIIDRRKLEDYALDAAHEDGRHKARVFRSVLGLGSADWRYLRDAILADLPFAPVTATKPTPYGLRCTVVVSIQGVNGHQHDVLTAWLTTASRPPRLVTAYVDL
jgi:hypothetical protein